ncbi:MAG: TonB-dependent receptor [Flavobacteriaceae bacterium]|nr:TonB-dependent receptor [Flavobacteriaceae bacterium]
MGTIVAQSNGTLRGKVSDQAGYLPGANVILVGTRYNAISSLSGEYYIGSVKPGEYTMKISYIGYKTYEATITIKSGETTVQNVVMEESSENLNEVTITGNRGGQAKALNTQKEAITIKNVVSEDQIKSFPDLNTAEVLQRISGVTIQRDMGEGRFVALRGTSPSMTNVSVNGEQVAVSNGESRRVELDVISAAQLSGIEVTKVITPNMDGNAIGGAINLVTRSAFDRSGTLLKVNLGGGKNSLSDKTNFRSSVDYSEIFGKKKNFGVTLNANLAITNRVRESNESRWGDREDINDNTLPMVLRETQVLSSTNERDRLGFNGQLEYKFNDKNRIYFNGLYSFRRDEQFRQLLRMRFDKGDYISSTEVEGARVVRSLHDRVEKQRVTSFMFGGEHFMGKLKMDYKFSTSNAYTKKPDGQIKPEFQLKNVDAQFTNLDSKTPGWTVTNGLNLSDGSLYEFDGLDLKYENTENNVYTAAINFTLPLILGSDSGEFIFGGKHRTSDKNRKDIRQTWKWEGDDPLLLSQFEENGSDLMIVNNIYNLGSPIDHGGFKDFFFNNQAAGKFEATNRDDVNFGEPYDATDNITGLYFMTNQTYGNLLITTGLRAEFTKTDYTGTILVLDNNDFVSAESATTKQDYSEFFPNLQFRYRINDNTNFRLAYSRGIAQPEFFDMVPYSTINIDSEEIVSGNGDLKPTTSSNFDFLGEYFFKGIGILSGGVFVKKMDKFIFDSRGVVSGGAYDGYDYQKPINGAGANLFGIELTWQQQFTKLPGFLSGFGIYANYTYTKSSNIDLGPDTDRTDIDLLPFQMENVSNFALTYQKAGLTARLSANFSGKFLEEVGGDPANDVWRDSYQQWDITAGYNFTKSLGIFVEFNNIGNEPRYNYLGVPTRSQEHGLNGFTFNAGLNWSL